MSYNAYRQVQQQTENPRATEYRLFGEVTKSLMEIEELPKSNPKFIKALDWNRRMWSTLACDCGVPGNALPPQLRASIISLSLWVSKHTSKVMRSNAKIAPLIQINKTVMEGLKSSPQASDYTHQQASTAAPATSAGQPPSSYSSNSAHRPAAPRPMSPLSADTNTMLLSI